MSGVMLPLFMASGLAGAALAVVSPWRVLRDALALVIPALGTVAGIWLFATTAQHGTIASQHHAEVDVLQLAVRSQCLGDQPLMCHVPGGDDRLQ